MFQNYIEDRFLSGIYGWLCDDDVAWDGVLIKLAASGLAIVFLGGVLWLLLFGLSLDPARAKRVLEDQGYAVIRFTGPRSLDCGQAGSESLGFTALGPASKPVAGVLCGGYGTSTVTVRLNIQ